MTANEGKWLDDGFMFSKCISETYFFAGKDSFWEGSEGSK